MVRRAVAARSFLVAAAVAVGLLVQAPPASAAGASTAGSSASAHAVAAEAHRQVLRGPLVAFAAGLPYRAASLHPRLDGGASAVPVTVELAGPAEGRHVARLEGLGLDVRNVGAVTLEGYASAPALRALASDPAVLSVRLIPRPGSSAYASPAPALLGVRPWAAAGFSGKGIKVGVVDVGFAGLPALVGNALPATVVARCYTGLGVVTSSLSGCETGGDDHGTAVAETISQMAPRASLYVANPATPLEVQQSVAWMTANGVRVINSSVGWFLEGPGDGTSPYPDSVYGAVDAAVSGGALWVNAAGNAAHDAWAGPWSDPDGNGVLNWSGADERNSVDLAAGDELIVDLRWSSAASDYALTVMRGDLVVAASDDRQAATGDPSEVVDYTATVAGRYSLTVRQVAGAPDPRLRLMVANDSDNDLAYYTPAGSLPSPADSRNPGALAVGAVGLGTPPAIEPYSSQGPTSDGRVKPDLVAVDCGPTTVYVEFCGTSQAAPFVAGAAALVLESNPTLNPAALAARLREHTTPLGSPTPNPIFGAGLLALGPSPALVPAGATFAAPPASGIAGGTLAGQPAVTIVDAAGQRVASGPGSGLAVTLSLASSGTPAQLSCTGGTTRLAVAGVAAFAGCSVDAPGTYTLRADVAALPDAAVTLTAATSGPFTVLPAGSTLPLAISAQAGAVTFPGPTSLSVALALPDGASRAIELQRSTDGATWTAVAAGTTDATGRASFSVAPVTTARYRAALLAVASPGVEVSQPVTVSVASRFTLASSIASGRSIRRGTRLTLTAAATPAPAVDGSVARPKVRIAIYQRVGTTWRLYRTLYAWADASGRARLVVSMGTYGRWWIRARAEPSATNGASAWAAGVRYVVY